MHCYRNVGKRTPEQSQQVKRAQRCYIILAFSLVWVSIVAWRLSSIQIFDKEQWTNWAKRQHNTAYTVASERGPIFDRNGSLLAVSVPAESIFVRPKEVR
ncbi:MAG: hypothetical protein KDD62_15815, partial [Bdellovibrionales bacterium]|nr:hypothetical protein [Bdellovibrionales bacterium]